MHTGRFVWYELLTKDPNAALAFYKDVIGWSTQPFEGSPMPYTMWVGSQGPLGGVMTLPDEAAKMGAPSHWSSNVTVANVDATCKRVAELGGKVLMGPEDIPSVGRFAAIQDPQGATISIFTPGGDMAPHDSSKHGEFSWNELATTDNEAAFKFYSDIFGWVRLDTMDMQGGRI